MTSPKLYECPYCKSTQDIQTNHYGEVYSGCKTCRTTNEVMYPNEDTREFDTRAYVVPYRFDISKEEDREVYNKFTDRLRNMGIDIFDYIAMAFGKETAKHKHIINNSREYVMVHNKDNWADQFITDTGRLHRWSEAIFPNKNIKQGYVLLFDIDEKDQLKKTLSY